MHILVEQCANKIQYIFPTIIWFYKGIKQIYLINTPWNKSDKGAYMWSSPVCLSMCEGSEYTSLSLTKVQYSKCNNYKAVGIG